MGGLFGKRPDDMRLSIHANGRQMAMGDMTDGVFDFRPVGHVVGGNLARLRQQHRLTQHEAARRCQAAGLNWTRVRIAAIERGDRDTVDVGTLLLLAAAFGVAPAEFFMGSGGVRLSTGAVQSLAGVRRTLSCVPRPDLAAEDRPHRIEVLPSGDPGEMTRMVMATIEADAALAERLGVPSGRVVDAAIGIWGRSLTEERDARVAALGDMEPGERQAHRGHITRELAQEIERAIGGPA
jgi:transcriptional regulator with XRE-family HTH domain